MDLLTPHGWNFCSLVHGSDSRPLPLTMAQGRPLPLTVAHGCGCWFILCSLLFWRMMKDGVSVLSISIFGTLGNVRPVDGVFRRRTWRRWIALNMVVVMMPVCWVGWRGHFFLLQRSHVLVWMFVRFLVLRSAVAVLVRRVSPGLRFLLRFLTPFPFHASILEPYFYLSKEKKMVCFILQQFDILYVTAHKQGIKN